MTFLLSSLIAHVLADFALQPDPVAHSKARSVKLLLRHGLVVFLSCLVMLHVFTAAVWVSAALLIAVLHVLIDWMFLRLEFRLESCARSPAGFPLFIFFVVDQVFHLATVVVLAEVLDPGVSPQVAEFYSSRFLPSTVSVFRSYLAPAGLNLNKVLAVLLAYLFAIFAGARLVRQGLDALSVSVDSEIATHAGRYIGMLERVLILTLVLVDALPSIAFVLTAKSLARYRELAEMAFAEYYLIGTLASTCVAVLTGLVARWALAVL